MKLRPIDDRVVLRRVEADASTPGGIYIPETAREKQSAKAVVVAVGPGRYPTATADNVPERLPMTVEVGQTVLFDKWAGHEVEVEGDKVLVLSELNILAVLDDV